MFSPACVGRTRLKPDFLSREISGAEQDVERLQPWHRLDFTHSIEQEFLRQGGETWLRITRNWMLETLGLGIVMVWAAALSGPDAVRAALMLQAGASLPVVLALVLLPRLSPGLTREMLFSGTALVVVVAIAVQGWWMSEAYANRYVMASGLALFSIFLVVPLRVKQSVSLGVLGMAILAPITVFAPNPAQQAAWDLLVFTGLALPLSLQVRLGAERGQRKLFLLRRREDMQREALARANDRLRELSELDPLTGIANRRCFDAALHDQISTLAASQPLLLLIDVDHFKRFNDTYGHPQGDECLRLVAAALRAELRQSSDMVARIGGEEFAVLLPSADEVCADDVAERIRLGVERLQLVHGGRPDSPPIVTISVGVAKAFVHDTAAALIARADAALYSAKATGRNRAVWAECISSAGDVVRSWDQA